MNGSFLWRVGEKNVRFKKLNRQGRPSGLLNMC